MQFNLKRFFQSAEKKETIIIVGLGNPGQKYENTLHNMGYNAVEFLAQKLNKKIKKAECSALTSVFSNNNTKIVLAKPITYMNLSGQAVKSLLSKYNKDLNSLIVIYDDIDLAPFSIRARKSGSGGTHNGMKNIIKLLGSNEFKRIRIGVGRGSGELKDYVLSDIKKEDKKSFNECCQKVADSLYEYIQSHDFDKLMRDLNNRETNDI